MRHLLYGLFILLPFLSCEPVSSPGDPPLRISVIETSCTEAVLEIQLAGDLSLPRRVTLARNDSVVLNPLVTERPFLALDEGLLPAQTYRYSATVEGFVAAAAASGKTLDTTSHDWVFSDTTFGNFQSELTSVQIISDTLAYVGGWEVNSSAGTRFNLWRWNGREWKAFGIRFYSSCGQPLQSSLLVDALLSVGESDLWVFGAGAQATLWNGTTQGPIACLPWTVPLTLDEAWARSPSQIFAGGYGGMVAFDGRTLRRLTLPNQSQGLTVRGIDGTRRTRVGLATYSATDRTYLLRSRSGDEWEIVYDGTRNMYTNRQDSISGAMGGVFIPGDGLMYVATGTGLYRTVWTTRGGARKMRNSGGYIGGSGANDFFQAGTRVAHFNGATWREFPELAFGWGYDGFAVEDDLMILVGRTQDQNAVRIVIGRRTN